MKTKIFHILEKIRTSLLFLPLIIIIGGLLLAFLGIYFDKEFNFEHKGYDVLLYSGGAESARVILSTIAASMISAATLVFSITVVALTLASSQFGPRMLRNFMQNTTNQVVIGAFLSTFTYCLVVIRTVKSEETIAFVPNISVSIALFLALINVVLLIYFINHISNSIQADSLISEIYAELQGDLERMYPSHIGEPGDGDAQDEIKIDIGMKELALKGQPLRAPSDGYIQAINESKLLKDLSLNNALLRVTNRPGSYMIENGKIGELICEENQSEELKNDILASFIFGKKRTPEQDPEYALLQLVEIGTRALSPGINDPFTAIACVDKIGSAVKCWAQRSVPSKYRFDKHGNLRYVADVTDFNGFVDTAFNQIRQNAVNSVGVLLRLMETLTKLIDCMQEPYELKALSRHAHLTMEAGTLNFGQHEDIVELEKRFSEFQVNKTNSIAQLEGLKSKAS